MKSLIIICFLLFPIFSFGQTVQAVIYDYDNAGNRVVRDVQIVTLKPGKVDSQSIDTTFIKQKNTITKKVVEFKVYPNPFKEYVVVENKVWDEVDRAYIKVLDATGRHVKSISVNSIRSQIPLGDVSQGKYNVIYYSNNKVSATWQVIKL